MQIAGLTRVEHCGQTSVRIRKPKLPRGASTEGDGIPTPKELLADLSPSHASGVPRPPALLAAAALAAAGEAAAVGEALPSSPAPPAMRPLKAPAKSFPAQEARLSKAQHDKIRHDKARHEKTRLGKAALLGQDAARLRSTELDGSPTPKELPASLTPRPRPSDPHTAMAAAVLTGLAAGGRAAAAAAAGGVALPPSPALHVKRPHTTPAELSSSAAPAQPTQPAKRRRSSLKVRAPLDYRINDCATVEKYLVRYTMPTNITVSHHAVAFCHMRGRF